jgi:hypothetical protein
LTGEELMVELVRGWEYLFDRSPQVLRWITDHQQSRLAPLPYPVAGWPTSPG